MSAVHVSESEPGRDAEGFYTLPPEATLAADMGMSVRTFRRHIKQAAAQGWVIVASGNRYKPAVPDHLAHLIGLTPEQIAAEAARNPPARAARKAVRHA